MSYCWRKRKRSKALECYPENQRNITNTGVNENQGVNFNLNELKKVAQQIEDQDKLVVARKAMETLSDPTNNATKLMPINFEVSEQNMHEEQAETFNVFDVSTVIHRDLQATTPENIVDTNMNSAV